MRTILVLVIALVVAAPAEASWPRVERARAVAIAYWGQTPDCPHVYAMRATLAPEHVAEAAGCSIYFNRDWWALKSRAYFPRFCSVYVHEWGHLLGWYSDTGSIHSDDPNHVMFYSPRIVPACRAASPAPAR